MCRVWGWGFGVGGFGFGVGGFGFGFLGFGFGVWGLGSRVLASPRYGFPGAGFREQRFESGVSGVAPSGVSSVLEMW